MKEVQKAIFPVAGLGTRFLPATIASPKEMLALVDKPVIQCLVEEAVASGIDEFVMITGRSKRAIEDHFDPSPELEEELITRGKKELAKEVKKVSQLGQFVYVRQREPKGDGDAIMYAEKIVDDNPFAVLFGDDVVDSKVPCLKQLIDVYNKYEDPVIAVTEVPREQTKSYGVIKGKQIEGNVYQVFDIVEKPEPKHAPSNLAIVGKYVITPDIFGAMRKTRPGKDGELRLADGLKTLLSKRPVYACKFEGKRYDMGNKTEFLKAVLAYAFKDAETKKELKEFIKDLK